MASVRATEVVLAVVLATLCCAVTGFTPPTAAGCTASAVRVRSSTSTSPLQSQPQSQPRTQRGSRRGLPALQAAGSEDDGVEEYKRQVAEFMAQAHEKRLEAMEQVKAEVQRGYEQQIADLQSKLAALPASARDGAAASVAQVAEPQLVGAGAEASISSVGAGSATTQHPGYAARSKRPGWEARWGPEEPARASTTTTPASVSAADVVSMEARAKATASDHGAAHPAYAARSQRPGWEARWGNEEVARIRTSVGQDAAAGAGTSHPAYAARAQRPGWEARWGSEEAERTEGGDNVSAAGTAAVQGDVHPAYAARARRPGWEARWGSEEPARMASAAAAPGSAASVEGAAATPADSHLAYAARAQRPGWEARWGSEEPARMASAAVSSPSAAPAAQASAAAASSLVPPDAHPAYAARVGRPGWEARWGGEEKDRVAGAPAGAVAVAGAAAGFATAGGLDAPTAAAAAAAAGSAGSVQGSAGDPLEDDLLPDDAGELKNMVVSNRRHFQEYLLKSLEASNELKQSKTTLDAELSSSRAKLAAEEQLRESLQASFLEYISRSGDAGAAGKTRIAELENDVVKLAAQAEELKRFTQEYMVKAASDKQNAIEEAAASASAQSAERIAALQAQVLELQAGG